MVESCCSRRPNARRTLGAGLFVVWFGIALGATGCAGGAASLTPPGAATPSSASSPVDPTAAASAETSVEEAASTYLTFVTAWNVKMEAAMMQWDAAGSDPVKLGTVNARFAGLAEEFASRLAAMSWPSSVQSLVDRFAADEVQLASALRALAGDPLSPSLQAQASTAEMASQADAVRLRQVLGLPPLTASATPAPTETPRPTPTPAPTINEAALVSACAGRNVPQAATYGGTVHPLVVVDRDGDIGTPPYEINMTWIFDEWLSPIQLVLCVDDPVAVKVGSCGTYTRRSDGVAGEIIRYKYTQKVRVIVAATGKQTGYKTLAGDTPSCAKSLSLPISGPPPWNYYGGLPSDEAINTYATSVSTK